MKKLIASVGLLACLFLSGCGNLSPRDNFNPNNQQGRIDRLENNQNSIRTDIDRISLFERENNNNGVQILQGDGGLFLFFGLVTVFIVVYYFYRNAEGERKTAEILAEQIVKHQDENLEKNVLKAAENSDVEENVCYLINKKKLNLIKPKNEE